jgi:bacterioferritin
VVISAKGPTFFTAQQKEEIMPQVTSKGAISADQTKIREILTELVKAYWMEMETVQNYLAQSTNLDGVRAKEIKESLAEDIQGELNHARQLAGRIYVLGGLVPGSFDFKPAQKSLQPLKDTTDTVSVIRGVIDAESDAIEQYRKIIEICNEVDWATQDLCIQLMADEQEHRREFISFLSEYDREGARQLGLI